jgi:hypothetical protein
MHIRARIIISIGILVLFLSGLYVVGFSNMFLVRYDRAVADSTATSSVGGHVSQTLPPLDTVAYDKKMRALAHLSATTSIATSTATSTPVKTPLWPPKTVYPNSGALLPFNRIVAYYGNFYSKAMGVLGEYPPDVVIQKLQAAAQQWQAADPSTPVIPAIDYIAVTAQASAGADGKYRARMPDSQIDKAITLAAQVHGIVILDVQVGLSNVQTEIPLLKKYLSMPQVNLALDPEFSMKDGTPPGKEIGTMNASDINFTAQYLAQLVRDNNLPPKILVVHRFTEDMVTGYKQIKPLPEVEIVMDMDGWGFPAKKINTYNYVIAPEPVQFTGFKLFYKADLQPPSTRLLAPAEVLKLTPAPSFIQYQ